MDETQAEILHIDFGNQRGTLHPDTYEAFEHIDAAMFTGDPGETLDKFNLMKFYVERWQRRLAEVAEDPWYANPENVPEEPSMTEADHEAELRERQQYPRNPKTTGGPWNR